MSGASDRLEASAILRRLQEAVGRGPGWLGFADRAGNVQRAANRAGEDGLVSSEEIEALVVAAKDFRVITDAEREVLLTVVRGDHGEVDPAARMALSRYLGVHDPGPALPPSPLPGALAGLASLEAIATGGPPLAAGARDPALLSVARALGQLGYPSVGGDRFDPTVLHAVTRFQRDHGLRQTGEIDACTLSTLCFRSAAG